MIEFCRQAGRRAVMVVEVEGGERGLTVWVGVAAGHGVALTQSY